MIGLMIGSTYTQPLVDELAALVDIGRLVLVHVLLESRVTMSIAITTHHPQPQYLSNHANIPSIQAEASEGTKREKRKKLMSLCAVISLLNINSELTQFLIFDHTPDL